MAISYNSSCSYKTLRNSICDFVISSGYKLELFDFYSVNCEIVNDIYSLLSLDYDKFNEFPLTDATYRKVIGNSVISYLNRSSCWYTISGVDDFADGYAIVIKFKPYDDVITALKIG